jgi:hypothetical protein
LEDLKWISSNNSEVSRYFLRHYITFLKGYDADFSKDSKLSINFWFEEKISGGSLCTGGTAGIWAMDLFSTTYFGENIIF